MRDKKLCLNIEGRKFSLNVKECNAVERMKGLMFSSKNSEILLFSFKRPAKTAIHSFFVFFPFVAVWLDEREKIVGSEVVRPFTACVKPEKKFSKIVEIPFNERNSEVVKILVGDRKI